MTEPVECLSGSTHAETPLALTWQGKRHLVAAVLSRGRTPESKWFRVRTEDGLLFLLTFSEASADSLPAVGWQVQPL